jgi:hypothetical protein
MISFQVFFFLTISFAAVISAKMLACALAHGIIE